jgi:transposase
VLALLLLATCNRQRHEIERLSEERAVLATANQEAVRERDELRRRLGLISTNSSKPPSSDGLKRKRRTARSPERESRKLPGRRPGSRRERRATTWR